MKDAIKINLCQVAAVRTDINMPISFKTSVCAIFFAVIVCNMESRRENSGICRTFHNIHGVSKFCVTCIVFCCNSNLGARTIISPSIQGGFQMNSVHIVGYFKCNFVIICSRRCCLRLFRSKEHPCRHDHERGHEDRERLFSGS